MQRLWKNWTHFIASISHSAPSRLWGHFQPSRPTRTHHVQDEQQSLDDVGNSDDDFHLHQLSRHSAEPIMATLLLNGKKLDMEVDTGDALSVLSEATRRAMFPDDTLDPSSLVLKMYTDEHMKVKGTLNVRVEYGEQKEKVVLVIVNSKSPSLMGRNWLKYIHLNWKNIFTMRTAKMKPLNSLLQGHQKLFSKDLGQNSLFRCFTRDTAKCHTMILQIQASAIWYKRCYQSGTQSP